MTDSAWRTHTSRLGWLIAVASVLASAIYGLKIFHVIVPEPTFTPNGTFVDNILAGFEHAQEHWLEDLTSSLLFAVAFAGIAVLGLVLRHATNRDDPRSGLMAVGFVVAGTLGVAVQLIYLGAIEAATTPEYCDCGFLAEELVSREMIRHVVEGIVFWMNGGVVVLFAVGLLAFAGLAGSAGWVPAGLAVFARVVAVLGLISVIWDHVAVPLLIEAGTELDFFLLSQVITIVFSGILVALWAAWLARAAGGETQSDDEEADPEPTPVSA
jgi:hypothetical protein